jgi:hypothetical protein
MQCPDEQLYYNLVCIFYGAYPDAREDLAQELVLPEERAINRQEEYELAIDSWGAFYKIWKTEQASCV